MGDQVRQEEYRGSGQAIRRLYPGAPWGHTPSPAPGPPGKGPGQTTAQDPAVHTNVHCRKRDRPPVGQGALPGRGRTVHQRQGGGQAPPQDREEDRAPKRRRTGIVLSDVRSPQPRSRTSDKSDCVSRNQVDHPDGEVSLTTNESHPP